MEKYQEIERSLIKSFRKTIWKRFCAAVDEYKMINKGDKIAVCISGGKDSMLLAKCIQEMHRHSNINFEVEYIVMDPGYSPINRQIIEDNAKLLNIPVHIFKTDVFSSISDLDEHPCSLCARMRRGCLYKEAMKLGCNKLALGHHFDDVIETILMGMLYGAQIQTMMPKLHSSSHAGMEVIRPLYMVREKDIISWTRKNNLHFIQCSCPFSKSCAADGEENNSKRQEIKLLIQKLRRTNPYIDVNIFNSVQNVNLSTIIGWHDKDKRHSFMDDYDDSH